MLMPKRYHRYEEGEIDALPAADAETRIQTEEFMAHESELLSAREYAAWAELLAQDINYVVPRRVSRKRARGEPEFEQAMAHFDDDPGTMAIRIKRYVESTALWAEDPPSRVRYHLSALRVRHLQSQDGEEWLAVYNVLIFRNRGDKPDYDLLSAQRQDVLRKTVAGLRLAKRLVLLDHSIIGAHNLSFFV